MATRRDFAFALGETWEIPLACVTPALAPMDLTGGGTQLGTSADGETLLIAFTQPATQPGEGVGIQTILVAASLQTGLEAEGLYYYEARAFLSDGVTIFDQLYGSIYLRPAMLSGFPTSVPVSAPEGIDLNTNNPELSAVL